MQAVLNLLHLYPSSGFEGRERKLWAGACWEALAYFEAEQKEEKKGNRGRLEGRDEQEKDVV